MVLKFTGVLGTHMAPRSVGLLESADDLEIKSRKWFTEDLKNLDLLCEYFNIPFGPNQYLALSLELAREVVPCFKVKAKEGRPRKWSELVLGMLAVEIERLVEAGNSLDAASKVLSTREPWASFLEAWSDGASSLGAAPEEAILTAYKSAKKSKFTAIARDSFRYHQETQNIAGWDANVLAISGNN